jgi:ankyrin repeat protein
MSRKLRPPELDLIDAALEADWPAVFELMSQGIKPTAADREGRTALHYACADGLTQMAALLVKHGANSAAKDLHDITPLHFAVKAYAPAVAQLLIIEGAEVDAADHEGNTPLHYAVAESFGRTEMIRILLERGASPTHHNRCGQTPPELAISMGLSHMFDLTKKAA